MNYTISYSELENKAMQYATADVSEWLNILATDRANRAINEIVKVYTQYKIDNQEPIPSTNQIDIVNAAFAEGIVKTGIERNAESASQVLPEGE